MKWPWARFQFTMLTWPLLSENFARSVFGSRESGSVTLMKRNQKIFHFCHLINMQKMQISNILYLYFRVMVIVITTICSLFIQVVNSFWSQDPFSKEVLDVEKALKRLKDEEATCICGYLSVHDADADEEHDHCVV